MQLINTGPEPFFEDVVDHMAAICSSPLACVAIAEPRRQWINGVGGAKGHEAAPGDTFDVLALFGRARIAVNDTKGQPAFVAQRIGAYLANPLVLGGEEVGCLYLADAKARTWTDFEVAYLGRAARLVAGHFEARAALAERDRRIELEQQLAEAGALYQAILGSMHEGLVVQSSTGAFIESNPAAREILGLSEDELYGRTSMDPRWIDAEGRDVPGDAHPQIIALATGQPQLGKVFGVERPSGERRWVEANAMPMAGGARVVTTFKDITERLEREKLLAEALRTAENAALSKQQFLANMSHEIRTPLNGILGMAQVLSGTQLDAGQREYVSTIVESGQTLTALLNDVLDLSKIEAGRFEIAPTDANFADLLRRQLRLWRPRAEEKGLDLALSLADDLPEFLAFDTVRVQQCVSNFISNAIKFTETGRVDIVASARRAEAGYLVEIRVRDTGMGMDDDTLARLFQPFVQADETTQRSHGGTGLGLSITRRLAELMGGVATARSAPGIGSTFSFSFRAGLANGASHSADADAMLAGDTHSSLRHRNLRVLLVDDHPVNRKIASLFLKSLNIDIAEAANGKECLDALAARSFDIVLLDMHMPVMDGPTTISHIRSSNAPWACIPVLALTADAMSGDRERYLAMGMNGYLSKPLAERELLAEINRVSADQESARAA
jgi:PAS domain S-box-containing protein